MKRIFLLPIVLILLRFAVPLNARADEAEDFTYTVIGQEVTVTGFKGEPECIEIPADIGGLPVTEVRDNAFYCCTSLRRITLPDSVKTMGHHCFYGCSALEEAVLPRELNSVGMGCFEGCVSLKTLTLPDGLAVLPDSCFRRCSSLTDLVLPQSITEVEKFCFCGCSSLRYISLGGRLKSIGTGTFYQCESLDTVYIPPSVTDIGAEAFGYTTGGKTTGITIIGEEGSAAEDYADENGAVFSASPETVQAFDPAHSENAPVKLPPALAATGGLLFLLAAVIAVKQYFREKKSDDDDSSLD